MTSSAPVREWSLRGLWRWAARAAAELRRSVAEPGTAARLLDVARRRPLRVAVALVGAAALLTALALVGRAGDPGVPLVEVRRGPFEVTVVESGTIEALRSMTYSSSIQSNQAKITALAPEGSRVEKGDLLILFDAAPFEESIRRHTALLAQAQADLAEAEKDRQLQALENEAQLASSRHELDRSRMQLEDVNEGTGRLGVEESLASVANAERELRRNESQLEDLRPLLAEGFITKLELERAEQQAQQSREELELARRRHEALVKFGRPLEVSRAEAEAQLSQEGMRQLRSAARYRIEQREAAIQAAESRIAEASSQLKEAHQQLARTEVRADVPGIVVYRKVFFGSEQRKPQVGDQVWANQPLIILPDVSKVVVETEVRETDIHKVTQGQEVNVRVAAYPDLELAGRVTLVGTLAQERSDRRGSRFFGVTVELEGSDERLRPGMTARVEILVSERPDAVYVPLEAVFERAGRTLCYVSEAGGLEERDVVLGESNQSFVVIERGLERGERVSLVDPIERPADLVGLPG